MYRRETWAATVKYYARSERSAPSSSASSTFPYRNALHHSTLWERHTASPSVVDCCLDEFCLYDLSDLGQHFGLEETTGGHLESATYCKRLLLLLLNEDDIEIVIESSVPGLENSAISELACPKLQIPDLYLKPKNEDYAQMVMEICSSPYEDTIRKCILGLTDLLRMRTMLNPNEKRMVGFCFPKLPQGARAGKRCVVELEVYWEGFQFVYKLKPLKKTEVAGRISEAKVFLRGLQPVNDRNKQSKSFVLQLAGDDLVTYFGEGAIQLESKNSIMIRSKTKAYKIPLWVNERDKMVIASQALTIASQALALASLLTSSSFHHVVNLVEYEIHGLLCFMYDWLPHYPMVREEAKRCIGHLFTEICSAIKQLHLQTKLGHMDIRLDNICFNVNYKPVLIDLERAERIRNKFPPYLSESASCMYDRDKTIEENDWMQFGWMFAWVLHKSGSYHDRKFRDLPAFVQEDQTLQLLILEGNPTPKPSLCRLLSFWHRLIVYSNFLSISQTSQTTIFTYHVHSF